MNNDSESVSVRGGGAPVLKFASDYKPLASSALAVLATGSVVFAVGSSKVESRVSRVSRVSREVERVRYSGY